MQDILDALITYFKGVSGVSTLVSTRVYGADLPDDEIENMPRQTAVLKYAGGPESVRSHNVQRVRVDVLSYGDGFKQAVAVDHAIADAAHDLSREEPSGSSTLIHSVGYGGPIQLREPETGWPYVVRTLLVIADERVTV